MTAMTQQQAQRKFEYFLDVEAKINIAQAKQNKQEYERMFNAFISEYKITILDQMKVYVLSDLHINWLFSCMKTANENLDWMWQKTMFNMLPDGAVNGMCKDSVLVIAGDLCDDDTKALSFMGRSWLGHVSKMFYKILVVPGNHSYYGTSICNMESKFEKILEEQKIDNVILLQEKTWLHEETNTLFVGTTLWTDFNKDDPLIKIDAVSFMSDYRRIRTATHGKLCPNYILSQHIRHKQYIITQAQKNKDKNVVVITHHLPSRTLCDKTYDGSFDSLYASSLEDIILDNENIKYWLSGHTHNPVSLQIGQCQCIVNPVGYAGYEYTGYDRNKHFILG